MDKFFFCLFLQILYNKNPQHLLKNKWGKKIRRIFVCISSCTLALNGRVSQDWQMYILVAVLSCSVTLKEHTHARTLPPLDFIFHFCFVSGGFNVFLCHSSSECKHTQAWSFSLDWYCHLQVVGSSNCAVLGRELQTLRAHRFEDFVETKPAL